MVSIVWGPIKNYAVSNRLADYFTNRTDIEGVLFFGYPILTNDENTYSIDATLVSLQHGVVLFELIKDSNVRDLTDYQDDVINTLNSKLIKNKKLMDRRTLRAKLSIVSFAPMWNESEIEEDIEYELATNEDGLDEFLKQNIWAEPKLYNILLQSIQAITTIKIKPKREKVKNEHSRGAKIKRLEEEIANLDNIQTKAVIETTDGPQRIRGLAGSGKTIVLALKVAYLHVNNPQWKIVVTFNTRSLKSQFIDLITRFTYEHIGDKPDWSKINIIHAWGNPKDEGIYYNVCKENKKEYYDFNMARNLSGSYEKAFESVCEKLLNEVSVFKQMYDVILIDEAQDFSKEFLKICYEILPEKKRLIFAYDELQSLTKQSMDTPENIFGLGIDGKPNVELKNDDNMPKEDIILETCYRNSRPILATAHALGFGIYREPDIGLIQLFDESSLWKEIGYKVVGGELEDDKNVRLARTAKSSPLLLEAHSPIDDLITFKVCNDKEEQARWVADQIEKNINEDELEYKDILVIHTNPLTTQSQVGIIRKMLGEKGINNHLAGVSTSPDQFFLEDSITFTSIHRAKGNEAAMVYVIDAQECYGGYELARKRNILFTAITRSKAWVRILGYGENAMLLKKEFNKVKSENFELDFIYPNEELRKKMNIIHRDKTINEKQNIKNTINEFGKAVQAISNGDVYLEDLPKDLVEKLKGLLGNE
ncbi:DEAD/DEAH box helicase [Clostridium tagluense]|uniref:DEAD/DEAH box helicase n=1 Tax=Clostridium tagluense TaxID=360422 RepID=UPI001C6DFF14|nr:ATP-binding domain-containing protein [Clostridium tagluense]MBW9159611.1 ATP-binding domain-containing protein [Clostridium tagluense]WLC67048.1 ATP-binding domain-containing protein [Clostridium tagluense]